MKHSTVYSILYYDISQGSHSGLYPNKKIIYSTILKLTFIDGHTRLVLFIEKKVE